MFYNIKKALNIVPEILSKTNCINGRSRLNLIQQDLFTKALLSSNSVNIRLQALPFHTSCKLSEVKGLNEFFDVKDNWGADEVKVGRSWKKEELRIKSNEDLHKLWYVLLKEKNMLLTMEEESKSEFRLFPNPERIDKVEESMSNLEEVVRERNRAYMLLETGETGERPSGIETDSFGRTMQRRFTEHSVPDYMNTRVTNSPFNRNPVRTQFSRLLREQAHRTQHWRKMSKTRYIAKLFELFPDVDVEAVKAKFPDIDVEKVRRSPLARGNHDKNMG